MDFSFFKLHHMGDCVENEAVMWGRGCFTVLCQPCHVLVFQEDMTIWSKSGIITRVKWLTSGWDTVATSWASGLVQETSTSSVWVQTEPSWDGSTHLLREATKCGSAPAPVLTSPGYFHSVVKILYLGVSPFLYRIIYNLTLYIETEPL